MKSHNLREIARARASDLCEYCHLPQELSELTFHIEHVIPKQHGGTDAIRNRALACPECNLIKGPNLTALDPLTGRIVRLFNPRQQKWSAHFAQRGIRITGKTAVGRATVALLGLNSEERLRVRALLLH